ncbi:hypothetical protein AAVH_23397, partial [Aphelenchoides avenae]
KKSRLTHWVDQTGWKNPKINWAGRLMGKFWKDEKKRNLPRGEFKKAFLEELKTWRGGAAAAAKPTMGTTAATPTPSSE